MKDEIKAWVAYATENLDSAKILLEQHLLIRNSSVEHLTLKVCHH